MPRKRPSSDPREFLQSYLPLRKILEKTRGFFKKIDATLKEQQLNRHDQKHQIRVTMHAVRAMLRLNLEHDEIITTAFGGLIHDIGYINVEETDGNETDEYIKGNKAKFKAHALFGAETANSWLGGLSDLKAVGYDLEEYCEFMHFINERGEKQMIHKEEIQDIKEVIKNHNDYGEASEEYNPKNVRKGALLVQLFDKLDHHKQRVYGEHMRSERFIEGSEDYDAKSYHQIVPYCINSYGYKINVAMGRMTMRYNVDIKRFQKVMREYPDFEYTKEDYVNDFKRAYSKSCSVGAEAIGRVLEHFTDEPILDVELHFVDGETVTLGFARPDRKVYKKSEPLKASIEERIDTETKERLKELV